MAKYNFKDLKSHEDFNSRFSVDTAEAEPCEFQKECKEDLVSVPANVIYKLLRSKGIKGNLSKKSIKLLSDSFFTEAGKNVNLIFSTYQGSDPAAKFSDATMIQGHTSNPGGYTLALHPLVLYQDEAYLLDLLDHEIKHIK